MTTTKQRHNERLLRWLLTGKSITPLDSWRYLGIYRLASRIHELRSGKNFTGIPIPIVGEKVDRTNMHSETVRVTKYEIDENELAVMRRKLSSFYNS